MKHLQILRLLTLAMALSLLLTGSLLPIAAEDTVHTVWSYNAADGTVTALFPDGDSLTYAPLPKLSNRLRFLGKVYYEYEGHLRMDGELCSVSAPYRKSDIIQLDNKMSMATKAGAEKLERLADGGDVQGYRLYASDGYYATMYRDTWYDLDDLSADSAQSHTLFDLKDVNRYEIMGVEEEGWYGVIQGYVFETEEGLFYASARPLPDNCFGSGAELLPKTTTSLLLIPLDEDMTEEVYGVISNLDLHTNTYHSESDSEIDVGDSIRGLVIASVIILGILCPIAPITLGLCLPHAKGLGQKKRWYVLTAAGGLWLSMGILLLVLLCTVM